MDNLLIIPPMGYYMESADDPFSARRRPQTLKEAAT